MDKKEIEDKIICKIFDLEEKFVDMADICEIFVLEVKFDEVADLFNDIASLLRKHKNMT